MAWLAGPAAAQEARDGPAGDAGGDSLPFGRVSLSLSAAAELGGTTFHRLWDPGPAVELGLETPFYLGSAEIGLELGGYQGREAGLPDFRALFPFVGWGLDGRLPLGLGWRAGLRIGGFRMRFEGDLPPGQRSESELGLALVAGARRSFGGWFVGVSARHRIVYTRERLRQTSVAVGLGRRFRSPAWLRDFLN